jgi:hypothetical protein
MNETNPSTSLDRTKDKVIVGNNAHTIHEHLKSLDNDPKHRQRWIWELMQNAQDANATELTVSLENNNLSFSHNGVPFSEEDITHLIFHGSSKPELIGKRGKFGTGFMTTHLLSKRVNIKGNLEDGRSFDFELTREANNDPEMAGALNTSWDNFKTSIQPEKRFEITTFSYLDLEPMAISTVENVLRNLPYLMPYVLVFSGQISKVTVRFEQNESLYYIDDKVSQDDIKTVFFQSEDSKDIVPYKMIVHRLENNKGEIAIPLSLDNKIVELPVNVPRLFITFPLIGTDQAFPLPFLINSEDFEPSSEREKLWLSAESTTPQTIKNKELLETAFREYIIFCRKIVRLEMDNVHLLANIGPLKSIEWLDIEWYKTQMCNLFNELDNMPLISVSRKDTERITLSQSRIPFSESEELADVEKTWTLSNYIFPELIPFESNTLYWQKVLLGRISYLNTLIHPSAFTLKDLCVFLSKTEENKMSNISLNGITDITFIQLLIETLEKFNLEKYWSEYAILPDQKNILKKSAGLNQELINSPQEIGEQLKNIAEGLNSDVRSILLKEELLINSENHRLPKYEKDTLVVTLVSNLKKNEIESMSEHFQRSSIDLLEWLLMNERWNELAGYPVKMQAGKWDKLQVSNEPFLAPASLWKENFQKYSELFPPDFILHEDNSNMLQDGVILQKANDKNLLLSSPLYKIEDELNSNEIGSLVTRRIDKDKLSKYENAEWEMETPIGFSKIAFFTFPKDKNVIDKARGARKRTSQLLEFITEVLISEDTYGFNRKEITIKSGDIVEQVGIYPSFWLRDIKNRDWVKGSGNNANRPSVESLLLYFTFIEGENNILYHSLENPEVSRLLHFLEIGVGDLLRNIRSGNNEDERINWDQSYVSILMNKSLTPEKVKGLLGDSEFIKAYEDKLNTDKQRKINQEIGSAVEKAFEKAFENLSGYKVKREPVGSDYIVECDYPHYLLLDKDDNNKFIIEIKSSRSTDVRMTYMQGKVANEKKENYVLCVVPLYDENIDEETIIKNARFVVNISALISNKVERVKHITDLQTEITNSINSDDIWTSIEGTNIRYVIGQQNWNITKPTVLDFKTFINGFSE